MKKFKIFTLLIYFLLQAVSFTANAQCDNITLTATATTATCYNNGVVTVVISGSDISNLRLTDAELRLTSTDGVGQSTEFTRWTGTGATKTFSQAVKGAYLVELKAFCNTIGDWITGQYQTTVTVPGNYKSLVFTAAVARKALTCVPNTGQITLNFLDGKPPYSITVTGPVPSSFQTSNTNYILDNLPVGTYTIVATDVCSNSTVTRVVTLDALSQDVPTTHINLNMGRGGSTDCGTIAPNSAATIPADWTYYWDEKSTYYEYCYLINGVGTKNWQSLTSGSPSFVLPSNYNDFCSTGNPLYYYIRPKGCAAQEKSVEMNLATHVCVNPTATRNTLATTDCSQAKLGISFNSNYAICYPISYKIAPSSNLSNIIASGTVNNSNNATLSGVYNRGVEYTITFTDSNNKVWTNTWTPESNEGQTFDGHIGHANGYYCNDKLDTQPVGTTYIYISNSISTEYILPGTVIKYISGPVPLPAIGTVGSSYTVPTGYNSYRFYLNGPTPTTVTYSIITAGEYVFEVTNTCGTKSTETITAGDYVRPQPLTFLTEYTCSGVKVFPQGKIQTISPTGVATNRTNTFYKIISGPSGVVYDNATLQNTGNFLLLSPGTYTIGMFYTASSSCPIATAEFVYSANALSLDPAITSAYVCEGKTTGSIRVKAINGVAPFNYTITAPGTTTPVLANNTTGIFSSFGTSGQTYDISVTDACNTSKFTIPVTMMDLRNTNISYAINSGSFCQGTEVEINCVSLGETTYSWTGPNGFSSNEQNPRFPALYPQSSGTYTVTVTPENCAASMTQSVTVTVKQGPPALTVPNPHITLCKKTGNVDMVALSGVTASSGCALNWYADATSTTTIAAPTSISQNTIATTTRYVSQTLTSTGCESPRVAVVLEVVTGTPPVVSISSPSICVGATTTLSPAVDGTWISNNPSVATVSGYTVTAVTAGSVNFTFTATGGCSATTSQLTTTATVTPSVSISGTTTVCSGINTTLTATPTNGGATPTYQWKKGGTDISGATSATYSYTPANGDIITCVLTSNATCASPATATSNSLTMVVNSCGGAISTTCGTVCEGGDAFTLTLTGHIGTITKWQYAFGPSFTSWVDINETEENLIVENLPQTAQFRAVVGTAYSEPITITTISKPTVSYTGLTTICAGNTTTLSPTTGGTWTSNNPSIATVNNAGQVSGVSNGSATFTYTKDGCSSITVPAPAFTLALATNLGKTAGSPYEAYNQAPNKWAKNGTGGTSLYMVDKVVVTSTGGAPTIMKWAAGTQNAAYFATGGTSFILTNGVPVTSNDTYTIYLANTTGSVVQTITTANIRNGMASTPFLLIDYTTASSLASSVTNIDTYNLSYLQTGDLTKDFELYENINMPAVDGSGNNWAAGKLGVAMTLQGVFDGNSHSINGLKINRFASSNGVDGANCGLFTVLSGGTVKNLAMTNIDIKGSRDCGSIAGVVANGALVENCFITGSIEVGMGYVGGITGNLANGSTIKNCYTTCSVTKTGGSIGGLWGSTGGIVGCNATWRSSSGYETALDNPVINCYTTGTINNGYVYTGGIVGVGDYSLLSGNYALNPTIICPSAVARIYTAYGTPTPNTNGGNNYAYSGVLVNGSTVSSSDAQSFSGADITKANATSQAHYAASGWNFGATGPWTFTYTGMNIGTGTNLPVLKSFSTVLQNPKLN